MGSYQFQNSSGGTYQRNFLYQNGQYTSVEVPGSEAYSTQLSSINDLGQICGTYVDGVAFKVELFVDSNGSFSTFALPSPGLIESAHINNKGEIAGFYRYDNVDTGFTIINGQFSTFTFPGATYIDVEGVNDLGRIVGSYGDSTGGHAFVATAPVHGTLTVAAGTTATVLGPQDYAGKTLVYGELDVAAAGSIAASQQVALKASGAVFDVSGAGAGGAVVTIPTLSGVAGSTIRLGCGVLSVTESTAATFAGAITDGGAGGGLSVRGSAPLTLTARQAHAEASRRSPAGDRRERPHRSL